MTTNQTPPPESNEAERLAKDAEVLDLGSLQEVALWLAAAAAAGVVGNTAHDVLRAVGKRLGGKRMEELRQRVYQELRAVRRKPQVSNRDLRARVDRLFDQLDS